MHWKHMMMRATKHCSVVDRTPYLKGTHISHTNFCEVKLSNSVTHLVSHCCSRFCFCFGLKLNNLDFVNNILKLYLPEICLQVSKNLFLGFVPDFPPYFSLP